jgi:hypothetical protein
VGSILNISGSAFTPDHWIEVIRHIQDIATKRSVPVSSLPSVSTWADVIELDEGRM